MRRTRDRSDRGSASLEFAVLAPPLLALIALAAIGARIQDARTVVEAAAHDAARAASVSRNAGEAGATAPAAADYSLSQGGLECSSTSVTYSPSLAAAFGVPPGTPSSITVSVTCIVPLAEVAYGLPVPATRTIVASFTSPLDQFRART